ncbi:MAG: nitrogen regulation protein NR(II) [bacterium]
METDHFDHQGILKPIWLILVVIFVVFAGYEVIEQIWLRNASEQLLSIIHILRGVGTALLVGFLVMWYFINQEPFTHNLNFDSVENWYRDRMAKYTRWFIQLRWVAVVAVSGAVLFGKTTEILPVESFYRLLVVVTGLTLTNLIYLTWYRFRSNYYLQLVAQMLSDLLFLTLLLHCSGGLENPFFLIYVFHVILASILFSRFVSWMFTGLTSLLFVSLGMAEFFGIIPHITIKIFPHDASEHAVTHASRNIWFVSGRMFAFIGVLLCTTLFVNMIMDQLRRQEGELIDSMREARTNQQRLEGIIQAAGLGIVLLNKDCQVEWYNQILEDWFSWGVGDAGEITCPFEIKTGDGEQVCVAKRAFENGEITRHEVSIQTEEEEERDYYITSSPVRDESGDVVEVIQVLQDITERKLMQAEMNHAGRMRLLGRLSSGIAHEIGNPLNSMKTRIHRMKRKDDPEFIRDNLDFLDDQLSRIDGIVHGISQFSQRRSSEWGMIDVNEILQETLEVIKMDKKSDRIEVRTELAEDLPRTAGVYNQLEQVFLNLLINAIEIMDGTGTLKISTQIGDGNIRITISDSGPGIPPEKRETIFNPFYTEKQEGSGLGLSISRTFIHAHAGNMEVEDSDLGGARFIVEIPLRQKTAPPVEQGRLATSPEVPRLSSDDQSRRDPS